MKPPVDCWIPKASTAANEPPLLINEAEAARLLGISERTMWSLAKRGEIVPVRIGNRKLYRRADVHQYASIGSTCPPSSTLPSSTEATRP